METARTEPAGPPMAGSPMIEPRLGLWDAVSLIVGIIVGVGIFETPSEVFSKVPGPWPAMGLWALGGIIGFLGAACFAELASTYPRSGGEYNYITRSFGSLAGYIFAWAQLTVVRPGSIAALAYVFADYLVKLTSIPDMYAGILAILAIGVVTCINMAGVTLGKNTQNALTFLKILGVGGIIAVGLLWGESRPRESSLYYVTAENWFAAALVSILWTYAGWHEAGYVAAEVRNSRRNLPLALALGTAIVTIVYLLINLAYWLALGFADARVNPPLVQLPVQVLSLAQGDFAGVAISVLIIISALGAMNGTIFTTARINTTFGADFRVFRPLGKWDPRWRTPVIALAFQGLITIALILAALPLGRDADGKTMKGIMVMIYVTSAPFWIFFLLAGMSVFVLRKKDSDIYRPFRVPGYPVVPLLFCLCCAYMIYASVVSNPWHSAAGLGIMVLGLPFYFVSRNTPRKEPIELRERTPAAV